VLQAGLFSAVASAFIIEVNSDLKPDPNEETAALIRVLIYKIDNTTFNDVPTIPQWTGPPRTTTQVQAILFASLAASLLSAFVAMLGKQWLNRYASVNVRGSAIERCQNRQRKLCGIVNWYFDHVVESLPLMLQTALLLLGCALSRYFWDINTTIASVILGASSLGVFFFLFIVVAGAVFPDCPYQTPGAHLLHRFCPTPAVLLSFPVDFFRSSHYYWSVLLARDATARDLAGNALFLFICILNLPTLLFWDPLRATMDPLMVLALRVYIISLRGPEQLQAVLDVECIMWTLQTSLDESIRLLAMKLLTTTSLHDSYPTLAVDCLDILLSCVKVVDGSAVVVQGSEQFAGVSALCCLRTISHLAVIHPPSGIHDDLRRRYIKIFPSETEFSNLQFCHVLGVIHHVFYPVRVERLSHLSAPPRFWHVAWRGTRVSRIQWEDYKPTGNEHTAMASSLIKFSQFEFWRTGNKKVPRWLLRFALHNLSQEPLPTTLLIIACLSIVGTDLSRSVSQRVVLITRYVP
jgi:hypothetical protein